MFKKIKMIIKDMSLERRGFPSKENHCWLKFCMTFMIDLDH